MQQSKCSSLLLSRNIYIYIFFIIIIKKNPRILYHYFQFDPFDKFDPTYSKINERFGMDLDFSNINGMVCDRFLKCNRVGQFSM